MPVYEKCKVFTCNHTCNLPVIIDSVQMKPPYVLISGKNPIIKVLYYSLNGRSGNFLSLACACWWWQQKASWPKFDYKVVSILTETFFLGKHFGRIFTLKVSLNVNIHFRRKSIKLTGISNFVGRKNISSKKVLEA